MNINFMTGSKYEKAIKLNISILNEEEILNLLNINNIKGDEE